MKVLVISLALGALISGINAARYWYLTSTLPLFPLAQITKEGAEVHPISDFRQNMAIFGLIDAFKESSRLNAIAARWTAAGVVLGALATLASILNSN